MNTHLRTIFAALCLVAAGRAAANAQTIRVVSPASGVVMQPGQEIIVDVSVTGARTRLVGVAGSAIEAPENLSTQPYRWQVKTTGVPGEHKIVAVALLEDGRVIAAPPVTLHVARNRAAISSLTADLPLLPMLFVGDRAKAPFSAVLLDGQEERLGAGEAAFTSQNTAVAAVDHQGWITAVAPGRTVISAEAYGRSVSLHVEVPGADRGDLDRNGRIDMDDLLQLQTYFGNKATTPNDARDLNRDGAINALDARVLTTLCTIPRCASR